MSRYKRYPEYKPSVVSWIGEVPSHWGTPILKRVCRMKSGESIQPENILESGKYPVYGGNGLRGYTSEYTHDGVFPLVGRQGALCGNINYGEGKFWASEHAVVVSPAKGVNPHWLGEALRAMNLNQYSVSAAQPGLAVEAIQELEVPVPTPYEQSAIAKFLDLEVARIDALSSKKLRFIQLLKEKRQALITRAVTKGLDPDMRMKDSGVEWIGAVPEHWNVTSLTRLATRVVVGIAEAATHAYSDTGIPILRSTNIRPFQIGGTILHIKEDFATDRESKMIRANDLVTVRTGNAGVTAVVPEALDGCQCFTMLITSLKSDACPYFYCYWMNCAAAIHYFSMEGWGTAQVNISVPILKDMPVPVPPFGEQQRIVRFLNERLSHLDRLVSNVGHSITLLEERRSALIAAAVTGQIDLRGTA